MGELENERESHEVTMRDLSRVRRERNDMSKILLERSNTIHSLKLRARAAEDENASLRSELALLRRFLKGKR